MKKLRIQFTANVFFSKEKHNLFKSGKADPDKKVPGSVEVEFYTLDDLKNPEIANVLVKKANTQKRAEALSSARIKVAREHGDYRYKGVSDYEKAIRAILRLGKSREEAVETLRKLGVKP